MRIIVMLFAAVLLVGCSNDSPEPENTNTESPIQGPRMSESQYADVVRDNIVGLRNVDDATLVENAHLTCDAFDSGATFRDVVSAGMASGLSPETTGGLVGAAIGWECPEHSNKIP